MKRAFPRLTSRDPGYFWTSGQWMTEKGGGSDVGELMALTAQLWSVHLTPFIMLLFPLFVSFFLPVAGGTETIAVPEGDDRHRLYGYKWFSSATDADMAFTLARVVDSNGTVTEVKCFNIWIDWLILRSWSHSQASVLITISLHLQGTRGLSLFYVETRTANGDLNGIQIQVSLIVALACDYIGDGGADRGHFRFGRWNYKFCLVHKYM